MATAFNLTAQLNLRGPNNVNKIVADIKKQLSGITANVNLKLDPNVAKNVKSLDVSLKSLNSTLARTATQGSSAASAIASFGRAVNSVNIKNIPSQINATISSMNKLNKSGSNTAQSLTESATEMQEFGKQAGLAIRRFAAFSAVTGVIYSLTNSINQGVQAFIEYDKELVRLQQVTGQTAGGLKSLQDSISQLATGLGVSSKELTTVSVTLAQAGLSAKDTERALRALALSSLAPSFDNMNETVEGSIALMRQFGISAGQLEQALGSINAVAAAFAVEADDLITAIQRTGGVFATASKGVSEGTDALNEFISVFTSVRATTRESAETIATGLRTIFTRIQRGGTIDALKEFGVTLTDSEDKFVGAYRAVQLLSEGLSKLDPRDIKFSRIVEELGGFRQIGKVIPLIQQFAVAQNALKIAQTGQASLAKDSGTAQLSLANKIQKVREEFFSLFREIGQSKGFQSLVSGVLTLTRGLIKLADVTKSLLPALSVVLAFKGASALTQFASGFSKGFRPGGGKPEKEKPRFADGGRVRHYAKGGHVPGSGSSDTVPAMLTPGEFVVNKKAARAIGSKNLNRMNRYAKGGIAKATVGNILDGDTFQADILPQGGTYKQGVRVSGYDAYEYEPGKRKNSYVSETVLKRIQKSNKNFSPKYNASKQGYEISGDTLISSGLTAEQAGLAARNKLASQLKLNSEVDKKSLKTGGGFGRLKYTAGDIKMPEKYTTGRYQAKNLGGMIQKFIEGGVAQRKVGYIDYDVIANADNETVVKQGMQSTGMSGPRLYTDYLTQLAVKARKDSNLQKLRAIYGVAGSGKTTLARGQGTDNAKLRQTERFPILSPEDIQRATEVIVLSSSVSKDKLDNMFDATDRTYTLSSTTKKEQENIGSNRESRDVTGVGLENRKPGSTRSVAKDSAVGEALLSDRLGDRSTVLTRSDSGKLRRKQGNELVEIVKKKIGFTWGGYSPMTAGHESILDAAGAMGISPEDFVFMVGSNEGIVPGKEQSYRTAIFDQDTRVLLAKAGAGARGATVLPKPRDFEVPQAFDLSETGQRRKVLIPGKGSTTFVADKTPEETEKYKKAGYKVQHIERTGGISGTMVRDLIKEGNLGELQKVLSPGVYDLISNNIGRIQNRASILPSIIEEVQQTQGMKLADVEKQIKAVGISRIDSKQLASDPEYAAKVEVLKELREKRDQIKSSASFEPHRLLAALAAKQPEKYGLDLSTKSLPEMSPTRTVGGQKSQKANIGGLIQKFMAGGIAEGSERMTDALASTKSRKEILDLLKSRPNGLQDTAKQVGVSTSDIFGILGTRDPDARTKTFQEAIRREYVKTYNRQAGAKQATTTKLENKDFVFGAAGVFGSASAPENIDIISDRLSKSAKVRVVSGVMDKSRADQLDALINEGTDDIAARGARLIKGSEPTGSVVKDPSTQGSMQGIILEQIIQKLGGPGKVKGQGFDFPNGLKDAAQYFSLPPDIPTDLKRTLEGPSTIKDNIVTYLKNVMGYAGGGKVDYYSLEKNSGFKSGEFDLLVNFAKTSGFSLDEFKKYLQQRSQYKQQNSGLRMNPASVLRAITPEAPKTTDKQKALIDQLRGEPDPGYRPIPTAAERIASDRVSVRNATRGFANGGTVPALLTPGEAVIPPGMAKKIGYGKLSRMNKADSNGMGRYASGGGVGIVPGSGNTDSFGPVPLPVGSFVIRKKATEALGFNKGGSVPVQKFATGGGVTSMIMEWLSSDMVAGTKPKMPQRPDIVSRATVTASSETTKALDALVKSLNEVGFSAKESADILNKGGQVSYKTIEKALVKDIERLKKSTAGIDQITQAEAALARIRSQAKKDVGTKQKLEETFRGGGRPSGSAQQKIYSTAMSMGKQNIEAKEAARRTKIPQIEKRERKKIIESKREDYIEKEYKKQLAKAQKIKGSKLTSTEKDKLRSDAELKGNTKTFKLTTEEKAKVKETAQAKTSLSSEERAREYNKAALRATSSVTGTSRSELAAKNIKGSDILQYAQESMRDRKTLAQMDKQFVAMAMDEYKNRGTVNGIVVKSAAEAKKAAEEEISKRREAINARASQNGEKGVGAAGLRDYRNSPILNQIKGFIKSPGRVAGGVSVAAGLTAGSSDMIAKNMYNMSTTEGQGKASKTSAAIQSSGTILSTGMAAASQMAAIPVIGPYVAAITAVGTAAVAAADYFYDFTGAQKAASVEFERAVRAKEIGIAMDGLDRAFQNFEKDMGNINLQKALEKSLGNSAAVETNDIMKERDNARADFALKNRSFSDLFSGNFKGSAKMDALEQKSMDSGMSQKLAPLTDKAMSLYEAQINRGSNIQDIVNNVKTGDKDAVNTGFAVAARQDPKVFAEFENRVAGLKNASEVNILNIKKEIAVRELLINAELQSITKRAVLDRAMEASNRAGRRLAETFEHISDTIDQSIQRVQRESEVRQAQAKDRVEARRGNAGFDEKAVDNRNVGVLTSPKAYQNDPRRIEEAIRAGTTGMAPELAQKMAGGARLEATLPNVMRNAISTELKGSAGLDLAGAATAARTKGTEAIKKSGLSEADQKVAIDKLNGRIEAEEKNARDNENKSPAAQVDAFADSISELGPEIANMFGNAGKRLDDIIQARQGIYNTFAKNLEAASEAARKARDYFNKARDIRYGGRMDLREAQTGVGESYAEAKTKSESDIRQLTGGATDPQAIGRNIDGLMAQRDQQMKNKNAAESNPALTPDQQKEAVTKFTKDIQATNNALNDNREALDKLANSADVAQKALDEVKNIKGLQQDRENFVNQLLTNTPEEADKLNQSFIRLQRNLSGGLNNASNQRDARNTFNDTLRRTGSLREATRAGNTVLADQRKQTLQLMQDPGFRGMMTLNMKNQALAQNKNLSNEDIDKTFKQQEAKLMRQMAVESGMINNPMVQQALAVKENPNAEPAMRKAAEQFLQSTGLQAKATEEQGRLELANVQSLLTTATEDLRSSIETLTATINTAMGNDGQRILGFGGPQVPLPPGARGVPRPIVPLGRSSGGIINGLRAKPQYASVGKLIDFSPKGTDTVPAMLTPGEFVVNARSTSQHLPLLKSINSGAGVDATSNMSKGGVVYLEDGGFLPGKFPSERWNSLSVEDKQKELIAQRGLKIETAQVEKIAQERAEETAAGYLEWTKRTNKKIKSKKNNSFDPKVLAEEKQSEYDRTWAEKLGMSSGEYKVLMGLGDKAFPDKPTITEGSAKLSDYISRWYVNAGGLDKAVTEAEKARDQNNTTSALDRDIWPNITKDKVYKPFRMITESPKPRSVALFSHSEQAAHFKDKKPDSPIVEHELTHGVTTNSTAYNSSFDTSKPWNPMVRTNAYDREATPTFEQANTLPEGRDTSFGSSAARYWVESPEVDARVAEIKRRYAFYTGKLVTNPEEAKDAWQWWKNNQDKINPQTTPESPTMGSDNFNIYDQLPDDKKQQIFLRMPELVKTDNAVTYAQTGKLITRNKSIRANSEKKRDSIAYLADGGLLAEFQKIDANKSNLLESGEIDLQMIQRLDRDRDNKISFSEYAARAQGRSGTGGTSGSGSRPSVKSGFKAQDMNFGTYSNDRAKKYSDKYKGTRDQFPRDSDPPKGFANGGMVSPYYLAEGTKGPVKRLGVDTMPTQKDPLEVAIVARKVDVKSKRRPSLVPGDPRAKDAKRSFFRLDLNEDGILDKKEGYPYQDLDKDKDGKVTQDEWENNVLLRAEVRKLENQIKIDQENINNGGLVPVDFERKKRNLGFAKIDAGMAAADGDNEAFIARQKRIDDIMTSRLTGGGSFRGADSSGAFKRELGKIQNRRLAFEEERRGQRAKDKNATDQEIFDRTVESYGAEDANYWRNSMGVTEAPGTYDESNTLDFIRNESNLSTSEDPNGERTRAYIDGYARSQGAREQSDRVDRGIGRPTDPLDTAVVGTQGPVDDLNYLIDAKEKGRAAKYNEQEERFKQDNKQREKARERQGELDQRDKELGIDTSGINRDIYESGGGFSNQPGSGRKVTIEEQKQRKREKVIADKFSFTDRSGGSTTGTIDNVDLDKGTIRIAKIDPKTGEPAQRKDGQPGPAYTTVPLDKLSDQSRDKARSHALEKEADKAKAGENFSIGEATGKKRTISGKIFRVDEKAGTAVVQKENGKLVTIPLEKLAPESRNIALDQAKTANTVTDLTQKQIDADMSSVAPTIPELPEISTIGEEEWANKAHQKAVDQAMEQAKMEAAAVDGLPVMPELEPSTAVVDPITRKALGVKQETLAGGPSRAQFLNGNGKVAQTKQEAIDIQTQQATIDIARKNSEQRYQELRGRSQAESKYDRSWLGENWPKEWGGVSKPEKRLTRKELEELGRYEAERGVASGERMGANTSANTVRRETLDFDQMTQLGDQEFQKTKEKDAIQRDAEGGEAAGLFVQRAALPLLAATAAPLLLPAAGLTALGAAGAFGAQILTGVAANLAAHKLQDRALKGTKFDERQRELAAKRPDAVLAASVAMGVGTSNPFTGANSLSRDLAIRAASGTTEAAVGAGIRGATSGGDFGTSEDFQNDFLSGAILTTSNFGSKGSRNYSRPEGPAKPTSLKDVAATVKAEQRATTLRNVSKGEDIIEAKKDQAGIRESQAAVERVEAAKDDARSQSIFEFMSPLVTKPNDPNNTSPTMRAGSDLLKKIDTEFRTAAVLGQADGSPSSSGKPRTGNMVDRILEMMAGSDQNTGSLSATELTTRLTEAGMDPKQAAQAAKQRSLQLESDVTARSSEQKAALAEKLDAARAVSKPKEEARLLEQLTKDADFEYKQRINGSIDGSEPPIPVEDAAGRAKVKEQVIKDYKQRLKEAKAKAEQEFQDSRAAQLEAVNTRVREQMIPPTTPEQIKNDAATEAAAAAATTSATKPKPESGGVFDSTEPSFPQSEILTTPQPNKDAADTVTAGTKPVDAETTTPKGGRSEEFDPKNPMGNALAVHRTAAEIIKRRTESGMSPEEAGVTGWKFRVYPTDASSQAKINDFMVANRDLLDQAKFQDDKWTGYVGDKKTLDILAAKAKKELIDTGLAKPMVESADLDIGGSGVGARYDMRQASWAQEGVPTLFAEAKLETALRTTRNKRAGFDVRAKNEESIAQVRAKGQKIQDLKDEVHLHTSATGYYGSYRGLPTSSKMRSLLEARRAGRDIDQKLFDNEYEVMKEAMLSINPNIFGATDASPVGSPQQKAAVETATRDATSSPTTIDNLPMGEPLDLGVDPLAPITSAKDNAATAAASNKPVENPSAPANRSLGLFQQRGDSRWFDNPDSLKTRKDLLEKGEISGATGYKTRFTPKPGQLDAVKALIAKDPELAGMITALKTNDDFLVLYSTKGNAEQAAAINARMEQLAGDKLVEGGAASYGDNIPLGKYGSARFDPDNGGAKADYIETLYGKVNELVKDKEFTDNNPEFTKVFKDVKDQELRNAGISVVLPKGGKAPTPDQMAASRKPLDTAKIVYHIGDYIKNLPEDIQTSLYKDIPEFEGNDLSRQVKSAQEAQRASVETATKDATTTPVKPKSGRVSTFGFPPEKLAELDRLNSLGGYGIEGAGKLTGQASSVNELMGVIRSAERGFVEGKPMALVGDKELASAPNSIRNKIDALIKSGKITRQGDAIGKPSNVEDYGRIKETINGPQKGDFTPENQDAIGGLLGYTPEARELFNTISRIPAPRRKDKGLDILSAQRRIANGETIESLLSDARSMLPSSGKTESQARAAEAENPGAVFESPLEGALVDASSPEVLKASAEARKKLAAQKLAAKSPEQISVEKTYGPLYREAKKANDTAEMARIKSLAQSEFKKRSQEASTRAEDKKNGFLPVMGKVLKIAAPIGTAIGYGLGSLLTRDKKKKEEPLASRLENASSLQEVFDLLKLAEKDKTGNPTDPLTEIGGSSPVVAKLQKLAPEIYGKKGSDYFSAQDLAAMQEDAYNQNFLDRLKDNAASAQATAKPVNPMAPQQYGAGVDHGPSAKFSTGGIVYAQEGTLVPPNMDISNPDPKHTMRRIDTLDISNPTAPTNPINRQETLLPTVQSGSFKEGVHDKNSVIKDSEYSRSLKRMGIPHVSQSGGSKTYLDQNGREISANEFKLLPETSFNHPEYAAMRSRAAFAAGAAKSVVPQMGATSGAIIGASALAPLGPPGIIAGGLIGGIAGGVAGSLGQEIGLNTIAPKPNAIANQLMDENPVSAMAGSAAGDIATGGLLSLALPSIPTPKRAGDSMVGPGGLTPKQIKHAEKGLNRPISEAITPFTGMKGFGSRYVDGPISVDDLVYKSRDNLAESIHYSGADPKTFDSLTTRFTDPYGGNLGDYQGRLSRISPKSTPEQTIGTVAHEAGHHYLSMKDPTGQRLKAWMSNNREKVSDSVLKRTTSQYHQMATPRNNMGYGVNDILNGDYYKKRTIEQMRGELGEDGFMSLVDDALSNMGVVVEKERINSALKFEADNYTRGRTGGSYGEAGLAFGKEDPSLIRPDIMAEVGVRGPKTLTGHDRVLDSITRLNRDRGFASANYVDNAENFGRQEFLTSNFQDLGNADEQTRELSKSLVKFMETNGGESVKMTPPPLPPPPPKLPVNKYATGGIVYANNGALINAQPMGTDTVPAMLSPGEFVVNRNQAQKHAPILHAINSGAYSRGGIVNYLANGGVVNPNYLSYGGLAKYLSEKKKKGPKEIDTTSEQSLFDRFMDMEKNRAEKSRELSGQGMSNYFSGKGNGSKQVENISSQPAIRGPVDPYIEQNRRSQQVPAPVAPPAPSPVPVAPPAQAAGVSNNIGIDLGSLQSIVANFQKTVNDFGASVPSLSQVAESMNSGFSSFVTGGSQIGQMLNSATAGLQQVNIPDTITVGGTLDSRHTFNGAEAANNVLASLGPTMERQADQKIGGFANAINRGVGPLAEGVFGPDPSQIMGQV